jgi:hypothetical protein
MAKLELYALIDGEKKSILQRSENEYESVYTLPVKEFENASGLTVSSDSFDKSVGEEGWYLIPGNEHCAGAALIRFKERDADRKHSVLHPAQSIWVVATADAVYAMSISRDYIFTAAARYSDGRYTTSVKFDFADQPIADDIVIKVYELPASADYNDAIKTVRDARIKRGEIRLLREKRSERECLNYAAKYPLVRIRMGWKPVPCEVLHQTLENEPPMHVATTFKRVRELADEMKRVGVEGAEISLVGWNQKGHDGRWPDIFPVEEALGGEEELIKTIKHVRSLGYKITCHTNTADHYEIASTFSEKDLAKRRDGSTYSHGNWAGGQSFASCPETQLRYAKEDLPKIAALGFKGLHYIDCLSICKPDPCFDEEHPVTVGEAIRYYGKIMALSTEYIGGFSSEGCVDSTHGALDFSLYNCFRDRNASITVKPDALCDEVVPMAEILMHGIVLYNPSSTTVNHTIKDDDTVASAILLGGRPAMYIYSKFVSENKKMFSSLDNNWMGKVDLVLDTDEDLHETAMAIRRAEELYAPMIPHINSLIEGYYTEPSGVRVMKYEDGFFVAANFTDEPLVYHEKEIAPHSYISGSVI